MIAPQFKTWFYIYKNNTANDEFREFLSKDFLVDVKDIGRLNFDFGNSRGEPFQSDEKKMNSKDDTQSEIKFDDLKIEDGENSPSVSIAIADYDQIDKVEKSKVSKFDKEVDDQQFVEKSVIDEELKQQEDEVKADEIESGPEKISLPIKKIEEPMEIMEAQENRNFVTRVRH